MDQKINKVAKPHTDMKYISTITLIVFFLNNVKAHQDRYFVSTFDNVEIRIKTAWDCEEVIKSKIIGEYCSNLAKALNYKENIFIDLIHDYGSSMTPASFIAFNNGNYTYNWQNETSTITRAKKKKNRKQRIVIRQIKYTFTISEVLSQLEYAIQNLEYIKTSSQKIAHKGYLENMEYYFETIPLKEVNALSEAVLSQLVKQILEQRIFRPEENNIYQLSYFSQHGQFYLFYDEMESIQIIDSVLNIYSFNRVDSYVSFVFTSPNKFICVKKDFLETTGQVSRKHSIQTASDDYYRSIRVTQLNKDIYSIYHNHFGIMNHAVFFTENEKLISDFSSTLKALEKQN